MGVSDVWFRVTDLEVASGQGSVVTTTDGTEYLDFSSGIAVTSTGHCHPHVVAAIQEQAARFIHAQVNVYRHTRLAELADRLAAIAPDGIDTFFFANSGAEATEAAVKLAKQATGRQNVIVFQGSFHGRTHLAMAMTTSKTVYRAGHGPLPSGVFVAPFPKADDEVDACLDAVRLLLLSQTAPAETAAMLIEPVLGEGGYVPAPTAFLQGLEAHLPRARDPVRRRRGAERVRPHRHDVLRRAARRVAGRGGDGEGPGVGLPDLRRRGVRRADGPVAHREPRRHLRRQPDRLRRRHRHHRRAHRARLPRRRQRRGEQLRAGLRALAAEDGGITEVRGPGLMVASELADPARVPACSPSTASTKAGSSS